MPRRRGLEPVIDTIDNQKAYAAVIHYHQLRLLRGIGELQSNVREALGLPVRAPTDGEREFEQRTLEQAKAEADSVEANIKAQYETLMRERQARTDATSAVAQTPKREPSMTGMVLSSKYLTGVHSVDDKRVFGSSLSGVRPDFGRLSDSRTTCA